MLDAVPQPMDSLPLPIDPYGRPREHITLSAAKWVWATSGWCIGIFGLCSVVTIMMAIYEPAAVMSQMPAEQVRMTRVAFWATPACMGAFFILPSLALLMLGFGVRAGKRPVIISSLIILWTQAGLLALVLILSLVAGLSAGDPFGLMANLFFFGSVLVPMLVTLFKLHTTIQRPRRTAFSDEPWNSHLA